MDATHVYPIIKKTYWKKMFSIKEDLNEKYRAKKSIILTWFTNEDALAPLLNDWKSYTKQMELLYIFFCII
jgi:primosomal protein N' (replication factor Y)